MHVFAHNGNLPGIEQSRNLTFDRYRPLGETDSEHAFCALLERVRGLWDSGQVPPLDKRLAAVAEVAADLRKLGPANFLYADGDALFAHGHRRIQSATGAVVPPGLFLLSRRCVDADQGVHATGLTLAPGYQDVLLVASVPLTQVDWRPLAEGEIVAVSAGQVVGGTQVDPQAQ
jgi:glutamine amidotransferase